MSRCLYLVCWGILASLFHCACHLNLNCDIYLIVVVFLQKWKYDIFYSLTFWSGVPFSYKSSAYFQYQRGTPMIIHIKVCLIRPAAQGYVSLNQTVGDELHSG